MATADFRARERPDEPPAIAEAVAEGVVDSVVEQRSVLDQAVADQLLHARHVVVIGDRIHDAEIKGRTAAQAESLFLVLGHAHAEAHRLGPLDGLGFQAEVGVLWPEVQETLQSARVVNIDKVADCLPQPVWAQEIPYTSICVVRSGAAFADVRSC